MRRLVRKFLACKYGSVSQMQWGYCGLLGRGYDPVIIWWPKHMQRPSSLARMAPPLGVL